MKKIYQLSPQLIAKIAAGEVIERPAYAVKELIENAVDAGADEIRIEIEQAGLKKILVIDNGEGMSREDLEEAWKPHTTSKLHAEEDLTGIKSFGFRGEALASIAAMSRLTIKSKPRDAIAGTQLTVSSGKLEEVMPVGIPSGTQVLVEHLFAMVPARKKFLKSAQTELRHIVETVTQQALSFPEKRFSLAHNQKTLFDLPKNQDLMERIKILLGPAVFSQLLSVQFENSYVHVTGYVSHPQLTTTTSSKYFTFVNQRKISDKLIPQAAKEAYGTLLEQTAYPVFVLFLTLPHELVDVNVHPRKEQVSFVDQQLIFDTVSQAVRQTLQDNNLTFHNISWKEGKLQYDRTGATLSLAGMLLKEEVLSQDALTLMTGSKSTDSVQAHNVYIITPTPKGILLVDQHAAHERILYEQFLHAFQKERKTSSIHTLSQPIPVTVSPAEAVLLHEHLSLLKTHGFALELFHGTTYRILTVPELLKDRDSMSLVKEMLENVAEGNKLTGVDTLSKKMLAYLACRSAVMAGDTLTKEEQKELLTELEKTPNNATCPHGRPTRIEITLHELHKIFKRI